MSKRRIYNLIEVCRKMITTFPKQGYSSVIFNAIFYRNGKKLNAIEQADVSNFSHLVRSYDKSENPDKVKIEFKDQSKNVLIWAKTFEVNELDEEIHRTSFGHTGLGEVEVNEMVQRKFSELERQKTIEQLQVELENQKQINEQLLFEVSDLQTSLEAKKQIEYYTNIIGMAIPGLAKFFSGTPVGTAMSLLAGEQEEQQETLGESAEKKPTDQRTSIIGLIGEFSATLSNQELGTLYLLFIELEKDRSKIQQVLGYLTKISDNTNS